MAPYWAPARAALPRAMYSAAKRPRSTPASTSVASRGSSSASSAAEPPLRRRPRVGRLTGRYIEFLLSASAAGDPRDQVHPQADDEQRGPRPQGHAAEVAGREEQRAVVGLQKEQPLAAVAGRDPAGRAPHGRPPSSLRAWRQFSHRSISTSRSAASNAASPSHGRARPSSRW